MDTILVGQELKPEHLIQIARGKCQVLLGSDASLRIQNCRNYLEAKISQGNQLIYGINTGFGALCNVAISNEELSQLQFNLIRSHACGTGNEVCAEVVRLMLVLKAQSLAYGRSGVQLQTVQLLIEMYNRDILPQVFEQGSLGASGDLAPLAHLCLPLIGEGMVRHQGVLMHADEVLESYNLDPIVLGAKEGLALLNGTQFMSAVGIWNWLRSMRLSYWADALASLSADGFDCRTEPFHPAIHLSRPHPGQIETAENVRNFRRDSEIANQPKEHVQDPYSFRCVPQVHGASKHALKHAGEVLLREINSVTDNPNIFEEEDCILSGGNFHGQPLALVLDYLAIAMHELGNISERRTYLLISGQRGLPAFLVHKPGLNSGLMIPQYTAASIVSQNKQYCTPASADSIVSSNGQEDHVSMGANAATKLSKIIDNLERIFGIELLTATQALEFRRPLRSSEILEKLYAEYRQKVAFVSEDRYLHPDIEASIHFIRNYSI